MGKIRQLREDQLINDGSQEHIYPITHAKAVYSKDNENLQDIVESIREGEFLKDGSIKTRHLNDKSVTTNKLDDGSVTTSKISEGNVTTEKIANESITTPKIKNKAITAEKLGDDSVLIAAIKDKNVTEGKLADNAVTTDKLDNRAVTTKKIADKAITNEKIADNTLTLDKFDDDLRNSLEAATGLPSDILERFQNMSEDIAELQDSTYPIILSMDVSFVNPTHTVSFNVKNKGKDFVGDTLSLTKTLGNGTMKTLSNIPAASGIAQSPIEYNKETFKLEVGAKGHTTKSTLTTRYICYAGGNVSDTITEEVIRTFNVYSSSNVAFNPTVNTQDNQYIWLVVPSYLTISRVTSQGFDVTLASAQNITTSLGSFKAYRTANALTAQTWNLVIS